MTSISIRDWGRLISDKHPDFDLISYGPWEGSYIVRVVVARRKSDGKVFIARTGAQFDMDMDWESETRLTNLYPAVERVTYDFPRDPS